MQKNAVLAAVILSACSSPADPGTDAGTTPGTDTGTPPGVDGGPAPETFSAMYGPDRLEIGEERTLCVVVDLGNPTERQARAIRAFLPTGSHHMIIYRTSEALEADPFPCSSFETGTAVLGVQTPEAELVYPEEAGLVLAAHQHIRLEVHEINYTDAPIDVTGTVTFELYPEDGIERAEVIHLFTGNPALFLPAHMETTVVSFHDVPDGARIIGMASHTHSLGTHATIHRATSRDAYTELLHESFDWASPPFSTWTPTLELLPDEGLRLECTYDNTTDAAVTFGLEFADEMCFLGAYYYLPLP